VGYAEMFGGGALKLGYRLAKNKLLRLEYLVEGFEQLLVDGGVLTLEVEHGKGMGTGKAGL